MVEEVQVQKNKVCMWLKERVEPTDITKKIRPAPDSPSTNPLETLCHCKDMYFCNHPQAFCPFFK